MKTNDQRSQAHRLDRRKAETLPMRQRQEQSCATKAPHCFTVRLPVDRNPFNAVQLWIATIENIFDEPSFIRCFAGS